MSIWISYFISDIINNLVLAIVFKKINNINKKFKFIDYVYIIIASILTSLIIVFANQSMRLISKLVIILILYKLIYNISLVKTTITTCLMMVIIVISEMIFTIMVVVANLNPIFFRATFLCIIIINLLIILLVYLIFNIKVIKNVFSNIVCWSDNKSIKAIISCILAEIILALLAYQNYKINSSIDFFIICNLFLVWVVIFVIGFFKEKTSNNKLLHDYDHLLEYSKEYEKEVVEKSKKQHEYKNQLAIIENMIYPQNKKAINYIKDLLNEEKDDKDSKVLEKLTYIKSTGLKGFIHFKIKEMDNKKIESFIDISEQLNKSKLWKICDSNLQDISRCLGVYLDNAIESSSISDKKQISLLTYLENDTIVFLISNTYKGELDISKFGNEGYSSKGKNRGFGLSLAKEIIGNNESLSQYKEINGKYYTQKLYIKTK